MAFELAAVSLLQAGIKFEPSPFFRGWNRLEGRVRTEDFSRALRAEARDPMWFLTRQWQFLELRGDDAGSPIEARAALRRTPLERFASRENPSVPFPKAQPLEAVVEREAAPIDQVALIQLHRALDKVLVRQGASGQSVENAPTVDITAGRLIFPEPYCLRLRNRRAIAVRRLR